MTTESVCAECGHTRDAHRLRDGGARPCTGTYGGGCDCPGFALVRPDMAKLIASLPPRAPVLGEGTDAREEGRKAGIEEACRALESFRSCSDVRGMAKGALRLIAQELRASIRPATHRCKTCGALWALCGETGCYAEPVVHWHLRSPKAGACCDNAPMADQMEPLARAAPGAGDAGLRSALEEVVRRASLPIAPEVNGLPSSEAECAAAVEKCARLIVTYIAEPARRALASPPGAPADDPRVETCRCQAVEYPHAHIKVQPERWKIVSRAPPGSETAPSPDAAKGVRG